MSVGRKGWEGGRGGEGREGRGEGGGKGGREGGRGSSAVAVPIYCIHKKLGKKGKNSAKRDDSAVTKELDK